MSVTRPLGFRAAGVAAGIKESGEPDVAVVINDGPSAAAAGRLHLQPGQGRAGAAGASRSLAGGQVRAVVLNSGGANACTGPAGFADTQPDGRAAGQAARRCRPGEIAVCSTGLIGERLPMHRLLAGVDAAVAARRRRRAGRRPRTRSGRPTPCPRPAPCRAAGYVIGGMAKGAAMLAPALATMLVVLTTDADLSAGELDTALRGAVRTTFDRLDSDGCMSTNDTVLLLASGASGSRPEPAEFAALLTGGLRRPGPAAACWTPRARARRSRSR